jgi:hypothetical protein
LAFVVLLAVLPAAFLTIFVSTVFLAAFFTTLVLDVFVLEDFAVEAFFAGGFFVEVLALAFFVATAAGDLRACFGLCFLAVFLLAVATANSSQTTSVN